MQAAATYPSQPVLVRVMRGDYVESVHRGAFVLTDGAGQVIDGAGNYEALVFTRSAIKILQALPLVESGAADAFGLCAEDLALTLASHNAEQVHVDLARRMLARLALDASCLLCGSQFPGDPKARTELAVHGQEPSALHNNCSGKHAGFLTLGAHLGAPPSAYLDPDSKVQLAVRRVIAEVCDLPLDELSFGIDGCSAPTWRLSLTQLAAAFARVTSPGRLGKDRDLACLRLTDAAAAHPVLVAGSHRRLCTALLQASKGKLFPKIGAEGIYAIGVRGADRALACKIDDGGNRALHALVLELCQRFSFLDQAAMEQLSAFRGDPLRNRAGLSVGRIEVLA